MMIQFTVMPPPRRCHWNRRNIQKTLYVCDCRCVPLFVSRSFTHHGSLNLRPDAVSRLTARQDEWQVQWYEASDNGEGETRRTLCWLLAKKLHTVELNHRWQTARHHPPTTANRARCRLFPFTFCLNNRHTWSCKHSAFGCSATDLFCCRGRVLYPPPMRVRRWKVEDLLPSWTEQVHYKSRAADPEPMYKASVNISCY